MVGGAASFTVWDQLLQNAFADEVSGIDCVLETDKGQFFTYTVTGGLAHPV